MQNGPIGYTIDTCQGMDEVVALKDGVGGMEMRTSFGRRGGGFCDLLVDSKDGLMFVLAMDYRMVFVQGWQKRACLEGWTSFGLHT